MRDTQYHFIASRTVEGSRDEHKRGVESARQGHEQRVKSARILSVAHLITHATRPPHHVEGEA
jgi:hypothetical protein